MSKSIDRITLLSTFARIAERGSISAAARDLGISQASASRHLRELENRLGVQLVHRTTHALALTKDGESCLDEARALVDNWDALVETYAGDRSAADGPLKVVAPIALGQLHLADPILRFQLLHQSIQLTLLLNDDQIRFSEIGCDLWIKVGQIPDDTLIVKPIGHVERIIVSTQELASKAALKTPKDMTPLPCIALEPFEGDQIPLSSTKGKTHHLTARSALITNNILSAYEAAKLGVGYAVLPRWLVDNDLRENTLCDVLPDWRAPKLAINVAYAPRRRQSYRLKLFMEYVIDVIQAVPGIEPAP